MTSMWQCIDKKYSVLKSFREDIINSGSVCKYRYVNFRNFIPVIKYKCKSESAPVSARTC